LQFYAAAKRWLTDAGFQHEIEWQQSLDPTQMVESDFLREAAWVVYCSGFREAIVRRLFNPISLCYFDWRSARDIALHADRCVASALRVFANRRKHIAVATIAHRVNELGFEPFRTAVCAEPLVFLSRLPQIGAVTSFHLAKNLGFNVAKPDRHLVRLKDLLGYRDVEQMCAVISSATGDSVATVDLILWRYSERVSAVGAPESVQRTLG
jgi:hypothetical protein